MTRIDLLTNPMTTAGDIIKAGASGVPQRLAIGSTDDVLKVVGGAPVWGAAPGGSGLLIPTLLQSVKAAADDPPDDEWDDSTGMSGAVNGLDAKWVVVDGTSGTVSLLNSTGAGLYDLATRSHWILFQVGTASGDGVELRQDYTLPDGKSIVAALSFGHDYVAAVANNELQFGIGVNDNDGGPYAGAAGQSANLIFDTEVTGNGIRILGIDTASAIGQNSQALMVPNANLFYFRISRVGLAYWLMWSLDGYSWNYLGTKTMGTAANNLWLFAVSAATMANRAVMGCAWFRQGDDLSVDPWPL